MSKYHMRKQEREITNISEMNEILQKGKYAVISMCRDNEPYIVTLSYGYDVTRNALYFHTSPNGQKVEFIKQNPNVCAAVIDDRGYILNDCAHKYRSVVLYGYMALVEVIEEKIHGMEVLLNHLENDPSISREKFLKNESVYENILLLRLDITEITGKRGQ